MVFDLPLAFQSLFEFGFIETNDYSAIDVENGHAHLSGFPYHFVGSSLILCDVILGELNTILSEIVFRYRAVAARRGCVD